MSDQEQEQETATIFEDETVVLGRNPEGRILFRHNRVEKSFFVFRSKRMTKGERQLVSVMFERYVEFSDEPSRKESVKMLSDFLDYRVEGDVFCA